MIVEDFREYLADIPREGYSVRHDEHGSDPDLIDPGGNPVETWRADYLYEERMSVTCTRTRSTPSRLSCSSSGLVAGDGPKARDLVRGPGRGGQGWHDQALLWNTSTREPHGWWR